ncbi:MAG: hypothetical protein LAP85_29350 [Acidobacteriia bacterium]|nr:hypothetical protein [Terriglobia bacterium]
MRTRSSLAAFLLILPITTYAQNLYPRKDLAFAQIAVGGGYESVLNLTNRGTSSYNGTLSLFRASGQAWSPLVNGNAITNGKMDFSLEPSATRTVRITGSGGVEAGFATIKASGQDLTSFLEGTLTYYVLSEGRVVDSIGVLPSSETYLATIPFDDFSTIALALANPNTAAAMTQLTLFSETNAQVSNLGQVLQPNQHIPQYLWQFFPSVQMTKGRLEIQSDLPILGTALTDAGGQFSSLPLVPAVKSYSFTMVTQNGISGELSIWIDGAYVSGYVRFVVVEGQPQNPPPVLRLSGLFSDGILQLFDGVPQAPFIDYYLFNPFSLSMTKVDGYRQQLRDNKIFTPGSGTKTTLTAIK